jgi:hypothetical protein
MPVVRPAYVGLELLGEELNHCPRIVDLDEAAGRFRYDATYRTQAGRLGVCVSFRS